MIFFSNLFKKTFATHYIGQLRFFECIKTHESFLYGSSAVNLTLDILIREVFNKRYTADYSVQNLDLIEIDTEIKKISWIKNIKFLLDSDYSEIENRHDVKFFPCNYFFTLAKSLDFQSIDSDYFVFLTSDLIFSSKIKPIKSVIDQLEYSKKPAVYGMYFEENNQKLIVTRALVLNNAAVEAVMSNWKYALDKYLNEEHEYSLRNEYATFRLFQLCGIETFKNLSMSGEIIRFRSNMDMNILDTDILLAQQSEFSKMKRTFVEDIRNGKYKNK